MKKWVIVLAIIFLIGIPSFATYDFLVVELDELPEGEFLSEYLSTNGDFTARAYLIDRAAIRVEIDFGNEVKTIYWSYDEHTVKIKWLNNETVDINNHQLNIFKDTYNWKEDPRWEDRRGRY